MRDVDVAGPVVVAFHASAVLVAFTGVVNDVEHLADRAADDVLGKVRLIFRPLGLHDAARGILILHGEPHRSPEVLQHRPHFFRGLVHVHVTDLPVAHHLGHFGRRQNLTRRVPVLTGCHFFLGGFGVCAHDLRARRYRKAVVLRNRRQIRRNLQRRARRT